MASIYDWDVVAANNATADSDLTWAEGQAPSTVNNSARVMMQRGKQLLIDLGGSLTVGGTANALTLTAQSAFTTLTNGRIVSFRITDDNTAATTLNVNAIGQKAVVKMTEAGEAALVGAELQAGGIYTAQYSTALDGGSGAWLLVNPTMPVMPTGTMVDYAGINAPAGWLFCYGQLISRTTYAALFTAIGTTYGVGDGSTTFALPDARGRVIAGKDDMGGSSANRLTGQTGGVNGDNLGASGGVETHTLTTDQMPSHNHGGSVGAGGLHDHTILGRLFDSDGANDTTRFMKSRNGGAVSNGSTENSTTHTHTISSQGGGAAHNIVQPTLIANKIIKI